jgi:hypothetical protein
MDRQPLKDTRYHTTGYIDTDREGKQTGRDARHHVIGYYPRTNVTRDARFHTMGSGNLLAMPVAGC